MIKKTIEPSLKKLEVGDIVKVKIKKSEYKKELEGNTEALKKLDSIEKDLAELEGELIVVESEMSLISFNKKKDWMEKFLTSDNEFYFFNKEISIVKKVDNAEKFFKNYNSASSYAASNNFNRAKENIEYAKQEVKNSFKSLNDRKKKLNDAESIFESLKDVKPENTFEKLIKNKKIEAVQISADKIYVKTVPLDLYSLSDKKILEGLQYVIEISTEISNYPLIRIANISSYSNESRYSQHCCVSNDFRPCLGSVVMRTLSSAFFDLSLVISTLIMFLEKPDYETPHINESSFAQYPRFTKNKIDDLSKAFEYDFLKTLR